MSIFAGGPPATLAAKAATTTIPIIFYDRGDPVGSLALSPASRDRAAISPAVNSCDVISERSVWICCARLFPTLSRLAMLVNPNIPDAPTARSADGQAAARTLGPGSRSMFLHTSNEDELDSSVCGRWKNGGRCACASWRHLLRQPSRSGCRACLSPHACRRFIPGAITSWPAV